MAIYYMFLRKRNIPEIGSYHSYDIVAYDRIIDGPVAIIRDVTPNGDLAFHLVELFNRLDLSPIHLKDVIPDMLG